MRCSTGLNPLPPGMRFVVILGANRIHVASSTDATGYYAGTGRKLNIVRAPCRPSSRARPPLPRKIADKPGKNRIVSAGAIEDPRHPPVLPFHRFFGRTLHRNWQLMYNTVPTLRLRSGHLPAVSRSQKSVGCNRRFGKYPRGSQVVIDVFCFVRDKFR